MSLSRLKEKLYRSRHIRRLFVCFAKSPKGKRWVFLVGCYNSGTTLLHSLIAAHPDVDTLPGEGAAFTDELTRPEDFGWTRMWHVCSEKIELREDSQGPDPERVKRDWGLWLSSKKNFYLEKSIVNSARMRWLDAHFEDACFIAIVRNGYAVAEGIRRRAQEGKIPRQYPMDLCARQWVINNRTIDRDAVRVRRFMKTKYEDLVNDPAVKLEEILSYIGLSPVTVTNVSGGVVLDGQCFAVADMNPESISRLSQKEIALINREAGEDLLNRGYTLL